MSGAADRGGRHGAQALCRGCGLCCDGSLFWGVALEAGEAVPGGGDAVGFLPQPCRFHGAGGCAIYAARPGQCRAFTCGVLRAVLEGERGLAWAEAQVTGMRHLLAGLDAVLPGEGALYARAAAWLEDAASRPEDARIRARLAVYEEMIGDFRPLTGTGPEAGADLVPAPMAVPG